MAKKETTRILLEIEFMKFLLPEGTSVEPIRDLVNSISMDYYHPNRKMYYRNPNQSNISIEIIPQTSITKIINKIDNNENKKIIADEIISQVKNINKTLIFENESIKIDSENITWPEIADPEFNPEDFIGEILDKIK